MLCNFSISSANFDFVPGAPITVESVIVGSTDNTATLSVDGLVIQDEFAPADRTTGVRATSGFDDVQPELDVAQPSGNTEVVTATLIPDVGGFEASVIDVTPTLTREDVTPTAHAASACNEAFYTDVMRQTLLTQGNDVTFARYLQLCIEEVSRSSNQNLASVYSAQYLDASDVIVDDTGSVEVRSDDVTDVAADTTTNVGGSTGITVTTLDGQTTALTGLGGYDLFTGSVTDDNDEEVTTHVQGVYGACAEAAVCRQLDVVIVESGDTAVRIDEDGTTTVIRNGNERDVATNYIFDDDASNLRVEHESETTITIHDDVTGVSVNVAVLPDGQLSLGIQSPDDVTTGGIIGHDFNYGLPVDDDSDPATPNVYLPVSDDFAQDNLVDEEYVGRAVEDMFSLEEADLATDIDSIYTDSFDATPGAGNMLQVPAQTPLTIQPEVIDPMRDFTATVNVEVSSTRPTDVMTLVDADGAGYTVEADSGSVTLVATDSNGNDISSSTLDLPSGDSHTIAVTRDVTAGTVSLTVLDPDRQIVGEVEVEDPLSGSLTLNEVILGGGSAANGPTLEVDRLHIVHGVHDVIELTDDVTSNSVELARQGTTLLADFNEGSDSDVTHVRTFSGGEEDVTDVTLPDDAGLVISDANLPPILTPPTSTAVTTEATTTCADAISDVTRDADCAAIDSTVSEGFRHSCIIAMSAGDVTAPQTYAAGLRAEACTPVRDDDVTLTGQARVAGTSITTLEQQVVSMTTRDTYNAIAVDYDDDTSVRVQTTFGHSDGFFQDRALTEVNIEDDSREIAVTLQGEHLHVVLTEDGIQHTATFPQAPASETNLDLHWIDDVTLELSDDDGLRVVVEVVDEELALTVGVVEEYPHETSGMLVSSLNIGERQDDGSILPVTDTFYHDQLSHDPAYLADAIQTLFAVTDDDDVIGEPESTADVTVGGSQINIPEGGATLFSNLDTPTTDEFTSTAWIQVDQLPTSGTVDVMTLGLNDASLTLSVDSSGSVLVGSSNDAPVDSGLTVEAGEWTHVGASWSGDTHELLVSLINGNDQQETAVVSDVLPDSSIVSLTSLQLSDVNNDVTVSVDDVEVFDRAWTSDDFEDNAVTYGVDATSDATENTGNVIASIDFDTTSASQPGLDVDGSGAGLPVISTFPTPDSPTLATGLSLPILPILQDSPLVLPGIDTGSALSLAGSGLLFDGIETTPSEGLTVGAHVTPITSGNGDSPLIGFDLGDDRHVQVTMHDDGTVTSTLTDADGTQHVTDALPLQTGDTSYVAVTTDSQSGSLQLAVIGDHSTDVTQLDDVISTDIDVELGDLTLGASEGGSAVFDIDNVNVRNVAQDVEQLEASSDAYVTSDTDDVTVVATVSFDDDDTSLTVFSGGEPSQEVTPVVVSPLPHANPSTIPGVPGSGDMLVTQEGVTSFEDINTDVLTDGFTQTVHINPETSSTEVNVISTTVLNTGVMQVRIVNNRVVVVFTSNDGSVVTTDSLPVPSGDWSDVTTSVLPSGEIVLRTTTETDDGLETDRVTSQPVSALTGDVQVQDYSTGGQDNDVTINMENIFLVSQVLTTAQVQQNYYVTPSVTTTNNVVFILTFDVTDSGTPVLVTLDPTTGVTRDVVGNVVTSQPSVSLSTIPVVVPIVLTLPESTTFTDLVVNVCSDLMLSDDVINGCANVDDAVTEQALDNCFTYVALTGRLDYAGTRNFLSLCEDDVNAEALIDEVEENNGLSLEQVLEAIEEAIREAEDPGTLFFSDGTNSCYDNDGRVTCTGPGFDDPRFETVQITPDMSSEDIRQLLYSSAGENSH